MKILFVCAGNTCRSPMAEAMAQAILEERGRRDVQVGSAGACIWPGDLAAADTVAEMASRGMDIEGRPAVQLTGPMVEAADLILAVTEGVARVVGEMAGESQQGKIMTLGEYAGIPGDVDDPYGCGPEVYHQVADQLQGLVEAALDKILHNA